MRVGIVTHKLQKGDGQARVNYELVKELLRRGYHVTVFASHVCDELETAPGLKWVPVPVKGWPTNLLKNLVFSVVGSLKLSRRKEELDVVLVNGFIVWNQSDINAVHFVHSAWRKSPVHPFRLKKNLMGIYQLIFTSLNARLERWAFRRTRYLAPVSEKVRHELAALGFTERVRVIFNGVDIKEFKPGPAERARLGLPEGVPLALFAGDIKSPRKNLDTVLKALRQTNGLHLAVAGAIRGSPYVRLAAELGVADRVHFLGFRRDMNELMRSADFFVFPSRYEACTLAVLEAMASGLPVITTYQSGVTELFDGQVEAGIVLEDAEDASALAAEMERLAKDADLRARMGRAARRIAEQNRWEDMTEKYIRLIEAVAEEKRSSEERRVLAFATQGVGGDDEARLKTLLSQTPAQFFPFDRRRKLRSAWRLFLQMLRDRPRLVVMEGTGIAGGAALIAANLLAGIPYVVSSGDAVGPYVASRNRLLGLFFSLYEMLLYRLSAGFIGWTPYLAGRALSFGARFGMTAAGWAPFAYTEEELAAFRVQIRQKYGIPETNVVVGIAGNLNWNRKAGYCYGYELVQALRRIKRQDITVLIIGDGSGLEKLKALGGGDRRLVFAGRVDRQEVPKYLAAMDLASLLQSVDKVGSFRYTTKISEYLAAGLPVVTGKIPMSYDLNRDWMYRIGGSKPWSPEYIGELAALLESVTLEELRERKKRVPRQLPEFDRDLQVSRVSHFIRDILAEV